MTVRIRACASAAAVAAAAVLAAPTGAHASASPRPDTAVSGFHLTLGPALGRQGVTRAVYLGCEPPSGNAPHRAAACEQLVAAHGRVDRIPAQRGPCYLIYAPVRATAVGYWHGQLRSYSRQFPNRCLAIRQTGGALFDF